MHFRRLLPVLLLVLLGGCRKEYNYTTYAPPYRVDGLTDQILRKTTGYARAGSVYYPLQVTYNNGDPERVRLSVEGLPAGLYDTLYRTAGYPTFATGLVLADSGVAEGHYALKLVAQGDVTGRRVYPFDLTVLPALDCTAKFLGDYATKTGSCLPYPGTYSQTVQLSGIKNQILFPNLDDNGLQLYANLNCDAVQPLTVPEQTVNGVTYSGSGYTTEAGGAVQGITLYLQSSGPSGGCSYSITR